MVERIPSGTRDVLPDEMAELRAMTDRIRAVFSAAGFGEVYTPALEYEQTFTRANISGARPAYRVFDEHGTALVLRPDMTVPIARLVATRYANAHPPLRFSYVAHAYRGVRPQRGQSRELLQAGVELIGAPGPPAPPRSSASCAPCWTPPAWPTTASAWAMRRSTPRCWTAWASPPSARS